MPISYFLHGGEQTGLVAVTGRQGIKIMKQLIQDPRLINYVLLFLYVCCATRWAFARKWWDVLYWIAAFSITLSVTMKTK